MHNCQLTLQKLLEDFAQIKENNSFKQIITSLAICMQDYQSLLNSKKNIPQQAKDNLNNCERNLIAYFEKNDSCNSKSTEVCALEKQFLFALYKA